MSRIALSRLVSENALQLSRVPIPALESTAGRYLDSLRALKSSEIIVPHEAKLSTFIHSSGAALQNLLLQKEASFPATSAGYVTQALMENQLQQRTPLEVNRNPCFVLKQSSVADITDGSQTGVASALLFGIGSWLKQALDQGIPEGTGEEPVMDLTPLATEFSRSLVPSRDADRVQAISAPGATRHVIVLHDGHANLVRVLLEDGSVVPRHVLQKTLEVVLSTTPDQDNSTPVSVLTASNRSQWGQAYEELLKTPENAEVLQLFQEGMVVLCLDSSEWGSSGDISGSAALHGNAEEVENRWYDKHQLIVSADGRAAFNFEASSSWVPHWGRWISEVLDIVAANPACGASSSVDGDAVAKVLRPLVVTYGKSFSTHIRAARQEAGALVASIDGRGATLPLGSNEISRLEVPPEGFLQLALHLAHYRRRDILCNTASLVSLTQFYGGLHDTARTASVEVQRMCEAFKEHVKPGDPAVPSGKSEELAALARAAASRIVEVKTAAASGQGIDRHLRALQLLATETKDEAALAFFEDSLFQSSSRFLLNTCQYSPSWLSQVSVGPVDTRGCGVGYVVDASETRFFITTTADSPLSSCEEQCQSVITAAMDLYRILGGTSA